ncbi:MAG: STAS domain-containing protein [Bacillota bacterium]
MNGKELTLTSRVESDKLIIETDGYINNRGGEIIADECYRHMNNGVKDIVLDLKNSRVVNSIGISILIEIIEKLNETGGKIYFVNLDPSVEKTFSIMGLFQYAVKA